MVQSFMFYHKGAQRFSQSITMTMTPSGLVIFYFVQQAFLPVEFVNGQECSFYLRITGILVVESKKGISFLTLVKLLICNKSRFIF